LSRGRYGRTALGAGELLGLCGAGCRDAVHFRAPDELLRNPPDLDLLLVDEAATLPVPMLAALVARWPRMALATTVHGYEGTGRGFDLRFRAILDRDHPGWQQVELTTPIRWAPDDPLEALMNRLLCLDADLPEPVAGDREAVYEPIDRERLLADEVLLSGIMGLLVSAHYQTSPDDLRQLMDDPDTELHVLMVDGQPAAVAWVLHEGRLDEALAREVWLGRRRPRGCLMAQFLAFQGVTRTRLACITPGLPESPSIPRIVAVASVLSSWVGRKRARLQAVPTCSV